MIGEQDLSQTLIFSNWRLTCLSTRAALGTGMIMLYNFAVFRVALIKSDLRAHVVILRTRAELVPWLMAQVSEFCLTLSHPVTSGDESSGSSDIHRLKQGVGGVCTGYVEPRQPLLHWPSSYGETKYRAP